jgi:hypothetical protein
MASLVFFLLVAVAVLVVIRLLITKKQATPRGPSEAMAAQSRAPVPKIAEVLPAAKRRSATLTVQHNEPLLGSLFSREVEALPEGISRDEFERAVDEYQQQHLKEAEIKIPRSLNFNYEKYAAEQEAMRRNVSASTSKFIQREEVGLIGETLAKGVPTQSLAPRNFLKRAVAKRR